MLTLTVPDDVDHTELEREIVTALADRLRDDRGYELIEGERCRATNCGNEYQLHPAGSIVVDQQHNTLRVKLHGLDVDTDDLFTMVSSEIEQRHDGLIV